MGRKGKAQDESSGTAAGARRTAAGAPAAGSPIADADGAEPERAADVPSFEASAERLATIVEQLEGGELSLEAALELFEEGVQVARAAQRRLDEAERRVDELLGVDERGEPVTRELER